MAMMYDRRQQHHHHHHGCEPVELVTMPARCSVCRTLHFVVVYIFWQELGASCVCMVKMTVKPWMTLYSNVLHNNCVSLATPAVAGLFPGPPRTGAYCGLKSTTWCIAQTRNSTDTAPCMQHRHNQTATPYPSQVATWL
jgi:hypothetical protein